VNSKIRHVGINYPKPYSQPISEPQIPVPPIGKYTLHNVKQIVGVVKEFFKKSKEKHCGGLVDSLFSLVFALEKAIVKISKSQ
jgi:hypothetical protein